MSSLSVNTLMQNLAKQSFMFPTKTPPTLVERTHYSGPSSGGGSGHGSGGSSYSHGGGGGGGKKHGIALSALTLLAFLFFLNILQNCLQDMDQQMTPTQVIVMQARIQAAREAEAAEKRKGDLLQPENNTFQKEGRYGPDTPNKKSETNYYAEEKSHQIPVQLKTIDKGRNPG